MLPRREKLPEVNRHHDLKHLVHDFRKSGLYDDEIVNVAKKEGRILITKNIKHFHEFCKLKEVDMIGVTETVPPEELDRSIMAYLRKREQQEMSGKLKKIVRAPRKK